MMKKTGYILLLFLASPQFAATQELVEAFGVRLRAIPESIQISEANDGGLLVSGFFDYLNGKNAGTLIKLTPQGTAFPNFQKVTSDHWITKVESLPNGKILVMGNFTQINGVPTSNLSRLNSNGSLDASFHVDGHVYHFDLQSNGKIIIDSHNGVQRLHPDGTLDNTFNEFGQGSLYFHMRVGSNDRIYLTGTTSIQQLQADGTLNSAFGTLETDGTIWSVDADNQGNLILVGDFSTIGGMSANKVARLTAEGTIDQGLSADVSPVGQLLFVALRENGNLLVASNGISIEGSYGSVFELSESGELIQLIASLSVSTSMVKPLSNQKIIVSGRFSMVDGIQRKGIVCFNDDYTVDTGFAPDIMYSASSFQFVPPPLVDSLKNVIVVSTGDTHNDIVGFYDGETPVDKQVFRITERGEYDTSYLAPFYYSSVSSGVILPDGKVLLVGDFFVGPVHKAMIRLLPTGELDTSFDLVMDVGTITKVVVHDSLIYFSGQFNSVNGVTTNSIATVDMNGELQRTFSGVPQGEYVGSLAVQSDLKVIASTYHFDGSSVTFPILRLMEDGTADPSFEQGIFDGPVFEIEVDADDKIYAAGAFNFFNSEVHRRLIRLNSNGTPDNSFETGTEFEGGYLLDMELLPGGKLMVGGVLSSYRGSPTNGFAVINSDGSFVAAPSLLFGRNSSVTRIVYSNGYAYARGRIILNDYQEVVSMVKIVLNPLSIPQNLNASLSDPGHSELTWTAPSPVDAAIEIHRSDGDMNHFQYLTTITTSDVFYLDTIQPFTTCYYRIRSKTETSNSKFTEPVSVYWNPLPAAPAQLTATLSSTIISLAWVDVSNNEDGFIVQRKATGDLNFVSLDTTSINAVSFDDVATTYNSTYFYRIASVNEYGPSDFTAPVELATLYTPEPPSNLQAFIVDEQVSLTWADQSNNESGFIIEIKQGTESFTAIDTVTANTTSFQDLTSALDSTLAYRISAFNPAGVSDYSNIARPPIALGTQDADLLVRIYPNPTKSIITMEGPRADEMSIEMTNVLGVLVLGKTTAVSSSKLETDLSGLPDGLYLIRIRLDRVTSTYRVLKGK